MGDGQSILFWEDTCTTTNRILEDTAKKGSEVDTKNLLPLVSDINGGGHFLFKEVVAFVRL